MTTIGTGVGVLLMVGGVVVILTAPDLSGSTLLGALLFLLGLWVIQRVQHTYDDAHRFEACGTCGRCCCPSCVEARRFESWRAPSSGGYHGCEPAGPRQDRRPPRA